MNFEGSSDVTSGSLTGQVEHQKSGCTAGCPTCGRYVTHGHAQVGQPALHWSFWHASFGGNLAAEPDLLGSGGVIHEFDRRPPVERLDPARSRIVIATVNKRK